MHDDFFDILAGDDGDCEANRTPRLLSAVQYAIRTNLSAMVGLMLPEPYTLGVLSPAQVIGMAVEASKGEDDEGGIDRVGPMDMRARGMLAGVALAAFREASPLEAISQECKNAIRARPLSQGEQRRIQGLIHSAADAAGETDQTTIRTVAFATIRLFAMSDGDGRSMSDACWSALVTGMLSGFGDAVRRDISLPRYTLKSVLPQIKAARSSDAVQSSVSPSKYATLPADDGSFARALAACDNASRDPACTGDQARAIECMSTSYSLAIVLSQSEDALRIASEADGMSEGEVVRRLAVAMRGYAAGHGRGRYEGEGGMVQFDPRRGLSADMGSVTLYGVCWLCGLASESIGWSWEFLKARQHKETVLGDTLNSHNRNRYLPDMHHGYDEGWKAGELAKARIHRLVTTTQLHDIEGRFVAGIRPLSEKFHTAGYVATFLFLPAATDETPYMLPS